MVRLFQVKKVLINFNLVCRSGYIWDVHWKRTDNHKASPKWLQWCVCKVSWSS